MSGNELTSEGTPHCCLFPKMKWNIILEQRTCRLELIATWLFCVTQEDPKACTWTLTLRLLCSIQPPSSPSVLPPATTDMASLPGPEAAALAAPLPGIHRCYLCRHPAPPSSATPHSVHADPRHFSCTGFPQSTSPCLV